MHIHVDYIYISHLHVVVYFLIEFLFTGDFLLDIPLSWLPGNPVYQ